MLKATCSLNFHFLCLTFSPVLMVKLQNTYGDFNETLTEAAVPKYSSKQMLLQNFAIFTGKHLCWSLFLIKLRAFSYASTLLKESPTHVFCCEYCKFCKNNFFTEHLQTTASAWPMAPNLLKNLEIKLSLKGTLCACLNDSFRSSLRIYWLEIKVTGNFTKLTSSSMDIISQGAYLWCSYQIHNMAWSRDLRYTERRSVSVAPV